MKLDAGKNFNYEVGVNVRVENWSVSVNLGQSKGKNTKATRQVDLKVAVSF